MQSISAALMVVAVSIGSLGCDAFSGSITGDGTQVPDFDAERASNRPCGLLQNDVPLLPGDAVWSCNGAYVLVMQTDGNLVIYHVALGAIWSTLNGPAPGQPGPRFFPAPGIRYGVLGYEFVMQSDGNAVLYSGAVPSPAAAVFCSRTDGNPGSFMFMQDDGDLVVYRGDFRPLWSWMSGRLY